MGAPAKRNCALTKVASIPARRQSENTGPRLFDLFFDDAPHLEYFPIFYKKLNTKAAFAKAAFDTLRNGAVRPGPSRECDITFVVNRRPKSVQQLRDSRAAARRTRSVTVPSSWVTRECRCPGLRSPRFKKCRKVRCANTQPSWLRWAKSRDSYRRIASERSLRFESLAFVGGHISP